MLRSILRQASGTVKAPILEIILGSGRIYIVYVKLRAIYENDPDKFGYYGNDPDNVFITKMTSMFLRLLLTDCTLG
jgi:hypothetical protein